MGRGEVSAIFFSIDISIYIPERGVWGKKAVARRGRARRGARIVETRMLKEVSIIYIKEIGW
jgi:hypothetical protein